MGDFVAVLTYTLNLFQPLNFLGSVYNAVVMAIIDLTNLSELLAENPDVTDAPHAKPVPTKNNDNPDVVVEFDNVFFHYVSATLGSIDWLMSLVKPVSHYPYCLHDEGRCSHF